MLNLASQLSDDQRIADQLSSIPLFHDLEDKTLEQFLNQSFVRVFKKGEMVFLQDDPADYFYLIRSGWVKLFRETLEGTEAVIDVLTQNHLFGETAVFEDRLYTCSAQAVETVQAVSFPVAVLKAAIEQDNRMALNMLSSMSRYRRQQNRDIEGLSVKNAPQRIGCFLLRLCPTSASERIRIHLPYDKTLIASRLGMKPETFSRALQRLKDNAHISIDGPTVQIHDLDALIDYTCNTCSESFPCKDLSS